MLLLLFVAANLPLDFITSASGAIREPTAKKVIRAMDKAISDHVAWNDWPKWSSIMAEYFTEDMVYDTNYFDGSKTSLPIFF